MGDNKRRGIFRYKKKVKSTKNLKLRIYHTLKCVHWTVNLPLVKIKDVVVIVSPLPAVTLFPFLSPSCSLTCGPSVQLGPLLSEVDSQSSQKGRRDGHSETDRPYV